MFGGGVNFLLSVILDLHHTAVNYVVVAAMGAYALGSWLVHRSEKRR
jgi:hypothetical protein